MLPQLIKGNIFSDSRGTVSYVNDFNFKNIERFYILTNTPEHPLRAWQGHKLDTKNFYCLEGSFKICFVKIDNWNNPSPDLKVEHIVLTATQSAILQIPAGYANAVQALESSAKLLSFSTLPLDQVADDDVRYPKDTWQIPE